MYRFSYSGQTDTGLLRHNNEDTYLIDSLSRYCLVADGMGGAAAGELASRIFAQSVQDIFVSDGPIVEQDMMARVHCAFRTAGERMLTHVSENPQHQGMGCTAELLVFTSAGFLLGHIGDSRTYRLRKGVFQQLTADHSIVQEMVDHGLITPEQARTHALRNMISRAVGVSAAPALDTLRGPLLPGDLFLLCSDGLTDMVDDDAIASILCLSGDLAYKTDLLIDSARKAGGRDNITVVLASVT